MPHTAPADPITAWVSWMRAGGSPDTTVDLRRRYLRRFEAAARVPLLRRTTQDCAAWLGGHDWSPNTRKAARSSLRVFYAWAVTCGHLAQSPADPLPRVRVPRARPRPTPETAYRAALAATDPRVVLAVRLAAQCGLRRGELARARTEHVEADLLGYSLRVTGKGGNVRTVPLPDDLAATIRALPPGWLFPSPAPTRAGQPLTAHHLGKLVSAALPAGYTTHTLRHRCATAAYAATRDLRAVQELLGHASPTTTAVYAAVPDGAVRAAVEAAAS